MICFPNAKINLGLDIVGRRSDGYHNLVTVFYPVRWTDVLEIVPAREAIDSLTVTGRGCDCPPEKNLVMKAVRALRKRVDFPAVSIYLRKIIPDGAGLGGGSADASFTLVILNRMFGLGLDDALLAEIAGGIGADCPFFIYNRPMLARGTGDLMTPVNVNLDGKYIAIVKPDVHVSTAQAFARVTPAAPVHPLEDVIGEPPALWSGRMKNDFEASVIPQFPDIGRVKTRLEELGAEYAAMSGSGAAVFGIFGDDSQADVLAAEFPGYDTFFSPA